MAIMSMTGFGSREFQIAGYPLRLEVRTYNHRFCDVVVRCPPMMSPFETEITKLVRSVVERGRIEVFIAVQHAAVSRKPFVNRALAREYLRLIQSLGEDLHLLKKGEKPAFDVFLLAFRDIFQMPDTLPNPKRFWQAFQPYLKQVMAQVQTMRKREGSALQADLETRLQGLTGHAKEIADIVKEIRPQVEARLLANLEKTLGSTSFSKGDPRLLQEVVYYVERSDIAEEITRFRHHISEFGQRLKKTAGPVGRKLEFLTQEMQREANTMGSKSTDVRIAERVVEIKSEVERIREQIQNIE